MPKKDPVRPVISAPVGPVKSSRGPDLVRADGFRIVGGIDDCQGPSASEAATSTRASAGLPAQERAAAGAAVDAMRPALPPSASSSRFLRKPSFPSFGRTRTAKSLLPTSSTASRLPTSANAPVLPTGSTSSMLPTSSTSSVLPTRARPVENIMPVSSSKGPVDAPQPTQQTSKLPKSRTMHVLSDLKNSISRQNLSARFGNSRQATTPSQVPRPPHASTLQPPWTPSPPNLSRGYQVPAPPQVPASRVAASSHIPGPARASVQPVVPRPGQQHAIRRKPVPSQTPGPSQPPVAPQSRPPSQTPLVQAPVVDRPTVPADSSSRSTTPEPQHSQVLTAQPMEYWTGRFSRLNDKYMADDRAPETLLALRSGLLSQHRQRIDPRAIDEDDARHLHIFAQLDFLCATRDAKQSLREFQQAFARRFNRPILMPDGGVASTIPGDRRSVSEAPRGAPGLPPSAQTMGSRAGSPRDAP